MTSKSSISERVCSCCTWASFIRYLFPAPTHTHTPCIPTDHCLGFPQYHSGCHARVKIKTPPFSFGHAYFSFEQVIIRLGQKVTQCHPPQGCRYMATQAQLQKGWQVMGQSCRAEPPGMGFIVNAKPGPTWQSSTLGWGSEMEVVNGEQTPSRG